MFFCYQRQFRDQEFIILQFAAQYLSSYNIIIANHPKKIITNPRSPSVSYTSIDLMKYEYIRLIQLVVTTLYALFTHSVLPYFAAIIVSALPSFRSLTATTVLVISIVAGIFQGFFKQKSTFVQDNSNFQIILIVLVSSAVGGMQLLTFNYEKLKMHKYVTPVLMFMISLVSMPQETYFRNYHLAVFCIVLLLTYYKIPYWLLILIRILTTVEALYLFLVDYCKIQHEYLNGHLISSYIGENQWWHYFAYVGICVTCDTIIQAIRAQQQATNQQRRLQQHQIPMIELHPVEIQSHSRQNQNKLTQTQKNVYDKSKNQIDKIKEQTQKAYLDLQKHQEKQGADKKYIPPHLYQPEHRKQEQQQQKIQSNKSNDQKRKLSMQKQNNKDDKLKTLLNANENSFSPLQMSKKSSYSLYSQVQQKGKRIQQSLQSKSQYGYRNSGFQEINRQSQILNLFLLIPFTCFSLKYLEIPLYVYFITLHYSRAYSFIFFAMLLSIFAITFINYDPQNMPANFLLRLCLVFMVDKNFELAINIADAVRLIWLRNSFAIVLGVLFWFGLRTVNVFHMTFIIVILLFITKGSNRQNQKSFRNKNWKYLLGLFNMFLISRFIYQIYLFHLKEQNSAPQNGLAYIIKQFLALLGISHIYQPHLQLQFFNFIPLIISAVIAIQFWTYSSKIYQTVRQQSLLQSTSSQPLLKVYLEKLLNIVTLLFYKLVPWLSYAFVLVILVLIDFSLISGILLTYIVCLYIFQVLYPKNHKALYKFWLIFSRLVALQIILRYLFQFAKFEIVFSVLDKLPWFDFLQKYQQLFGLMIRKSSHVYLKTFTKFQLMMTLDFGMIFVAFLMYEYLAVVIKYHELKAEKQRIQQQHRNQILQIKRRADSRCTQLNNMLKVPENQQPFLFQNGKIDNKMYQKQLNDSILNQHQSEQQSSNQKIVQIYEKYIDFKLTNWLSQHHLQNALNYSTVWYLKCYLPLIGVYACIKCSVIMAFYLLIILKFYLSKNTQYYDVYIGSKLAKRIREVAQKWRTKPVRRQARELQIQLENSKIQIDQRQLETHKKYTKWIILIAALGVLLTYFSRMLATPQMPDFMDPENMLYFSWVLYVFGTSQKLNPSILIFLIIFMLAAIQSKSITRFIKIEQRIRSQTAVRMSQAPPQDQTICKYIDMQISILFGLTKMIQRGFVIVLVFTSILENKNPFGIIYLLCAWLLNSIGSSSILTLSRMICFLVLCQYFLIVINFSDAIAYQNTPQIFDQFRKKSFIKDYLSEEWSKYLSFGDSIEEITILIMSFSILIVYQLYFHVAVKTWQRVLKYLCEELSLTKIVKKLYQYLQKTYSYSLVYSPLCITSLCLALYFMDYTATNLFLSVLSIIFLFKSFLVENYADSRSFWKSYFLLLQALIVIFMLIYCVLSIPMYERYCHPILCSSQEFRTKVTKAVLLFILQIGVDMMKSHHFNTAMDELKSTIQENSAFSRLSIAYKLNDRKISKKFKNIAKKQKLLADINQVQHFVQQLKQNPTLNFDNKKQIGDSKQSWLDTVLQLLPSILDPALLMTSQQAKLYIKRQNRRWIDQKQLTTIELQRINQSYLQQFQQVQGYEQLQEILKKYETRISSKRYNEKQLIKLQPRESQRFKSMQPIKQTVDQIDDYRQKVYSEHEINGSQKALDYSYQNASNIELGLPASVKRKSYIGNQLPMQSSQLVKNLIQNKIRQSFKQQLMKQNSNFLQKQLQADIQLQENQNNQRWKQQLNKTKKQLLQASFREEKKNLLYLLLFQSVLSNWQYITYLLMILEHLRNMGLLTLPFPLITFLFGIMHPYQAPKNVWRVAFISVLIPIFFKFMIGIKLIDSQIISTETQYMLLGDNLNSILIQYLLVISIIIQCLILKVIGLYETSVTEVECMRMALIRNVINTENPQEELPKLYAILKEEASQFSQNELQYIFAKWESKTGYDYSTMLVSIQLTTLFFIFIFYDRMTIRKDLTFYNMIQYNQFTGGMVVLALVQLFFMLMDRFLAITNLRTLSHKWETTLIIKYFMLVLGVVLIHYLTTIFFPNNSGTFVSNSYVQFYYALNSLYFLIAALQIKYGIDQLSRGFMQRYTWYNGFVYMFFRAVPFLFEFKIFSDWTVTQTSLRLFDWIKFQEVFGRLYVAKCNSLFMQGKILGSKIQWWKKLLMGYPLLLTIILLLFGPLILFSALNPLASANGISGGYVQMTLKINKTNEYVFYTNSHITDIFYFSQREDTKTLSKQTMEVIDNYDLNLNQIQILNLQEYSDQYWQISKGSYEKLLNEPKQSLYELSIRIKFERNMTGPTPVYTVNTYQIEQQRIQQFKRTLEGNHTMQIDNFMDTFLRLDNNNGLHILSQTKDSIRFRVQVGKTREKKYWIIEGGVMFKMASDKYSKAIFGYSVMSFYISIILVIANYFRFLFQGSAHTIIMSDIPNADPMLRLCQGVYLARIQNDIMREERLFWIIIDLVRSPDSIKSLTGNYLDARKQTIEQEKRRTLRKSTLSIKHKPQ